MLEHYPPGSAADARTAALAAVAVHGGDGWRRVTSSRFWSQVYEPAWSVDDPGVAAARRFCELMAAGDEGAEEAGYDAISALPPSALLLYDALWLVHALVVQLEERSPSVVGPRLRELVR